ncbi:hypothetical protein L1887_35704 [Cichorium endivia]|nr:hypothetical protein L1887_35704 [Cichorium endivia]
MLLVPVLISEASLKKSSRWSNYISALPRQPYSLLYRYLEASQIRERAIERINNVTGTYAKFFIISVQLLVRLPLLDGRVTLVETFLDYDKSTKGVVFTTNHPYQPVLMIKLVFIVEIVVFIAEIVVFIDEIIVFIVEIVEVFLGVNGC